MITASLVGGAVTAQAATVTITGINGPSQVFVGELAAFNVVLGFTESPTLANDTLTNLTLTMTSGDGQTQTGSSATFAYGLPGLYTVTAQGSAQTSGIQTTYIPVYKTVTQCHEEPEYFLGIQIGTRTVCESFVIQTGFVPQQTTIFTTSALFGTTQINVVEARILDPGGNPGGTPVSVPEPGSLALLATGIAGVGAARTGLGATGLLTRRRHRKSRTND